MNEEARQGAAAVALAQQAQQLLVGTHAVQVGHAVVAEGGAQVHLQQGALGLGIVAVGGGEIQPCLAHPGLRVAGQVFIQVKGNLRGVRRPGMPRVHAEAGLHALRSGHAVPVLAGDGVQESPRAVGVVGVVVFHGRGR